MKKTYFLLLPLVLLSLQLWSQDRPCATNPEKVDWLKRYQQNPGAFAKTNQVYYVPVTIHLVGTDNGSGFYSMRQTLNAFCELNEDFAPAQIQFYIADIRYIYDSYYYNYDDFGPGYQMMQETRVPHTVNCYINDNPAGACGYSDYGTGIALKKSCISPGDNTWAHEMGHYLSLPHTFYGWEYLDYNFNTPTPAYINSEYEVELVDGSNCHEAADGFCDTPPDYLNYRWGCNNSWQSVSTQKDPNGVEFTSDGTLYMSYSIEPCSNRFSEEQMDAMRANLTDDNADLIANMPLLIAPVSDDFSFIPLDPEEGVTVPYSNSIHLSWEPVPNATQYIVQVNPISSFSVVFNQYIVNTNAVTVSELFPGKKYYWRIKPFNPFSTCGNFSSLRTFYTESVTGINDPDAPESYSVYPNPVHVGEDLNIDIQLLQPSNLTVRLYDSAGRLLMDDKVMIHSETKTLKLPTSAFSAGVYLLKVTSNDKEWQNKIILQP